MSPIPNPPEGADGWVVETIILFPLIKLTEAVEDNFAVVTDPSASFAVVTDPSARKETQLDPFQNSGCPVVVFRPATPALGLAGRVAFVHLPHWVPRNDLTSVTFPAAIVVALPGTRT